MSEEIIRCDWSKNQSEAYIKYHDEEWGVPVHDDHKHFEFLILEGAQAGLSWATILKDVMAIVRHSLILIRLKLPHLMKKKFRSYFSLKE